MRVQIINLTVFGNLSRNQYVNPQLKKYCSLPPVRVSEWMPESDSYSISQHQKVLLRANVVLDTISMYIQRTPLGSLTKHSEQQRTISSNSSLSGAEPKSASANVNFLLHFTLLPKNPCEFFILFQVISILSLSLRLSLKFCNR